MDEGTKTKRTIYINGFGDDVDEEVLLNTFSTFGDVLEVQVPLAQTHAFNQPPRQKHRGYAFVTFTSAGDALDAIDNMDLNELRGRVLRVNLAKRKLIVKPGDGSRAIWQSEEWLAQHAKPLADSGGSQARAPSLGVEKNASDDEGEQMEEDK